MKVPSLPVISLDPQLRAEVEAVLGEGESMSSFVEATVRSAVECRRIQAAFRACGQAAWAEHERSGVSLSADEVLDTLRQKTAARRAQLANRDTTDI